VRAPEPAGEHGEEVAIVEDAEVVDAEAGAAGDGHVAATALLPSPPGPPGFVGGGCRRWGDASERLLGD